MSRKVILKYSERNVTAIYISGYTRYGFYILHMATCSKEIGFLWKVSESHRFYFRLLILILLILIFLLTNIIKRVSLQTHLLRTHVCNFVMLEY